MIVATRIEKSEAEDGKLMVMVAEKNSFKGCFSRSEGQSINVLTMTD